MAATEEEQRRRLARCFGRAELSLEELWLRYFALGGDVGLLEIDAHLNGVMSLPHLQRDVLAHVVNERLDELIGRDRVPYSRPIRPGRPGNGPLAALVDLLEGAHRAPPERLPAIMDVAARALDLRVGVYLADYAQRLLVPVPGADGAERQSLGIDSTPAGEAFRRGEVAVDGGPDGPRLWAVLLDGVERLGVLEVVPTDGTDPHDPLLREQCRWLAYLFGHLVTITTQYGDGLDRVRRREHRGLATELLWSALPPMTGATDAVTVAAATEPAYDLASDVFDYALSETSVSFTVLDTGAREPAAAITAVVALSAYRAARRDGKDLRAQVQAVDEAARTVGVDRGVCGVVGRFDLATGRLACVIAGRPGPLLLRDGKVAGTLGKGHLARFGEDGPEPVLAEEQLRPGDIVVLYTDGVLNARDSRGVPLGLTGFVEVLEREVPARVLPEAARRITQAVQEHGELIDDASVLLIRPFNDGRVSAWF
ncbi:MULTISPECIES: PP2C family protein-serine/threonine phosphatase [Amycolatopsis]|uniref:Phosphatase n=1 Tax=Amycolatopsis bullii TaxID=941987 RepID=A0ABQ3KSN3_9PSEU|nr:PP2C family protein-serine/threonine phosphatase [Amycolatopsis bullii]GHG50150.1 phosphatase [Amycolatopsis bullii]